MSGSSYDAQIASIDAQIERLRARRRDEVARREHREKKAYNHACHVLGEMLLGASGKSWQELDYSTLNELLHVELTKRQESITASSDTSTEKATRRLRQWQHDQADAVAAGGLATRQEGDRPSGGDGGARTIARNG